MQLMSLIFLSFCLNKTIIDILCMFQGTYYTNRFLEQRWSPVSIYTGKTFVLEATEVCSHEIIFYRNIWQQLVEDIFVSRELPIFVLLKCEMMYFCVMKCDLHV